jgi:sulfate transport system permease protein
MDTTPGGVATRSQTNRAVLPGFRLTLGFTILYLGAIVLLPLLTVPLRAVSLGPAGFWAAVTDARTIASYRVTFGTALAAPP